MYTIQHFDQDDNSWINQLEPHYSVKSADQTIKQLSTISGIPIAHYRIIPTDLEIKLIPPAADHHYTPPTEQERISDQAVLDKLKADARLLNTPTEPTLPESKEPEYTPVEHAFNKTLTKTLTKTLETKRRRESNGHRYGENYVISKKDKPIKKLKEST
jgi:hypothetical protein